MRIPPFVYTVLLIGCLVLVSCPCAVAQEIVVERTLNFGSIIVHPDGGNVILDAKGGAYRPEPETPGEVVVTGGHCGQLYIYGVDPDMSLTITYPAWVFMTGPDGRIIRLTDIGIYSESEPLDYGGDDVRVGGKLIIPDDHLPGRYSGEIVVTITAL